VSRLPATGRVVVLRPGGECHRTRKALFQTQRPAAWNSVILLMGKLAETLGPHEPDHGHVETWSYCVEHDGMGSRSDQVETAGWS
jgi:hypothetical protein